MSIVTDTVPNAQENQQKPLETDDIFANGVNGLEAIALHLSTLNVPGNQLWVKVAHNQIYCAERLEGEDFTIDTPIYNTVGTLHERRKGDKCLGKLGKGILEKSHSEDGGAFLNFGHPQGGFTKPFLIGATDIGFEPDDLPLEVQKKQYIEFQKVTGLKPTLLSSGSISEHGHITSSELLTKEQGLYLRRLAAIGFFSDPCIANNLCQSLRFAGPFRKDKGRYQTLHQVGEKYTYQEIVEGFKKWFEYRGFPFPDSIPDDWWRKFSKILVCDKKKPPKRNEDGSLNIEAFNRDLKLLRAELEAGLEGFENEKLERELERVKRQKEYEKKRSAYSSINGGVSLSDYVNQANDRLGDYAFNVEREGRKTGYYERCNCPFHNSKSGNSAYIVESNGKYFFKCRHCTPDEVINGFLFNYCRDNGLEPTRSNYPKGKDFVEYAKIYCEKAGVSIPEREWKKTESPNQKDDFDIDKWKQEKALTVKKLKTFTPDLTVKNRISEYSPNELKNILLENGVKLSGDGVLDGIILNVKAPTGAGKTQFFIEVLRVFYQYTGCALLGYRNGLLVQTCERSNYSIIHINDNKDEFNDLRDSMRFGSCVDSILKVNTEWWEDKIIILDEVVSVLKHLLFSDTLKNKRAEVIDRFIHALRVARGVICLDGHNADFIASFFKGLTDKPVINLLNDYAIARPDIKFLEGTIKNQKLKKNDKSPFLKHIKDTIPHNPIAVLGDSKIFLKSLTEILESLGHKCLLITSETKRLKAVKDFIKDPDKSIQENRYDAVLFSPSAESGLSVDIKGYFKALYAFFFGVLGTDAQQQMIIRIRDIECPRYVWLRSHSIVTDSTFEKRYDDKALLLSLLTNEVNHLSLEYKSETLANLKDKIENVPTQLMELAEHFRLIAQHERFNFRESFCNAVVENGYSLERVTLKTDKESNQEQKAKTKAIKERESLEIFNASDKYLYDIAPMLGENATDADRAAFEKAKILTDLPNLEFEDLWSPDFVKFLKFDRIMAITHRRLYVLANNLELAQKLSDRRYQSYIQKDKLCPWEMKPEYLQARAIAQSGILKLITLLITSPAQLLTADHPMVKEIIRKCKKAAIYKPLGRSPGKDVMRFISWLLGRLGYTLKEQNYKTADGKKARAYVLDYDDKAKTQPYFDVIDRLLTARFERAVLAPKASTIPQNEPKIDQIDFEHLDPPQTHAGYASEAVPDHLNKIEKNDDHLEPIQNPLTTDQSTTANNDVPDVGDLVICDEFPEHHILEIVGLHYGDKEWVRIRGDWWPAGETELSHISHLKKVERAIA